jgi:hypothetical protein
LYWEIYEGSQQKFGLGLVEEYGFLVIFFKWGGRVKGDWGAEVGLVFGVQANFMGLGFYGYNFLIKFEKFEGFFWGEGGFFRKSELLENAISNVIIYY